MSKTLAKRLRKAERRAGEMEKELRYLRENRGRYAGALRGAEGELQTLRAVLAVLAKEELQISRKEILAADGLRVRSMLDENPDCLRIWVE